MKTSHCILSFNKSQLTEQCLTHLFPLAQKRNEPIVLLHNGSSSDHIDLLMKNWPTITHVVIPKNQGFASGANIGLSYCFQITDWVFFHTNDTNTLKLPSQIPSSPGLLAPLIYKRSSSQIDSWGGKLCLNTFKLFHCKNETDFSEMIHHQSSQFIPYVPGTAFLIHQSIFEHFEGFDITYHTYWEDVDLSYRIWLQNPQKIGLIFDWILRHQIGKTCHKNKFYTSFLFPRNRELFRKKFFIS